MSPRNSSQLRSATLFVVALAALLAAAGFAAGRLNAASTARPSIVTHVLQPSCTAIDNVTSTYTKIGDLGTFEVQSTDGYLRWGRRVGVTSAASWPMRCYLGGTGDGVSQEAGGATEWRAARGPGDSSAAPAG